MEEPPAERRRRDVDAAPPALVAEAASHPGGRVAEIDASLLAHPDGYVPGEAVTGYWLVGEDGRLTGEFEVNPRHGPPRDDLAPLTESGHWLDWLGDCPGAAVRDSVQEILEEQVASAELEWFKILDKPRFFTGGRKRPDGRILVTRAGLAVSFVLSVVAPDKPREFLHGVFSWAAVGLDRPSDRADRVWFDLGMDLDRGEAELGRRVYEIGADA